MSRIIWKGAISFGLVNIPVALKAASRSHTLDLDLLDQRDMAPVGYQRINKHTGKVIDAEHIVKGYQYEKDEYVLLSDEDFRQANVEATQTVDIVSFVEADSIPPYYFDTPITWSRTNVASAATRCCTRPCARPAAPRWRWWYCATASTWRRCWWWARRWC